MSPKSYVISRSSDTGLSSREGSVSRPSEPPPTVAATPTPTGTPTRQPPKRKTNAILSDDSNDEDTKPPPAKKAAVGKSAPAKAAPAKSAKAPARAVKRRLVLSFHLSYTFSHDVRRSEDDDFMASDSEEEVRPVKKTPAKRLAE
jgi:hypothetical protein